MIKVRKVAEEWKIWNKKRKQQNKRKKLRNWFFQDFTITVKKVFS